VWENVRKRGQIADETVLQKPAVLFPKVDK
jgi:hypothetical protein